jgi:hypothetical protein
MLQPQVLMHPRVCMVLEKTTFSVVHRGLMPQIAALPKRFAQMVRLCINVQMLTNCVGLV